MSTQTIIASASQAMPSVEDKVHDSLGMLAEMYEYNHWTYSRLRPYLGDSIFDIGCGNGNFIRFLLDKSRVVGLEPFGPSYDEAIARFRDHANIEFVQDCLTNCPNDQIPAASFDSVVCMRLLDSLENDVASLSGMRQLCSPNGNVIIVASAHMSAYGKLDRSVGHRRRYNKRSLRRVFEAARLRVVHTSYMNMPGYFGWMISSRILKRRHVTAGPANIVNRLSPYLDAFERFVPPLFGQSIIMVGKPV